MIKRLLIFAMGVAAGVGCTYLYLNDKYKEIAEEEIREAKERYSKESNVEENKEPEKTPEEKPTEEKPVKIAATTAAPVKDKLITEYHKMAEAYQKKPLSIYLITPEEYGQEEDFQCIGITYHEGDETFEDEYGEQMTPLEVENYLGEIAVSEHFGDNESEPDIVYVRNRVRSVDIEVLRDLGKMGD